MGLQGERVDSLGHRRHYALLQRPPSGVGSCWNRNPRVLLEGYFPNLGIRRYPPHPYESDSIRGWPEAIPRGCTLPVITSISRIAPTTKTGRGRWPIIFLLRAWNCHDRNRFSQIPIYDSSF